MGVAERVRVSTWRAISRSFSLWLTPKRCSSSMTSKPRSWNFTLFWMSLWVPMMRSTRPSARFERMRFCSLAVVKRERTSMVTGKERKRLWAVA